MKFKADALVGFILCHVLAVLGSFALVLQLDRASFFWSSESSCLACLGSISASIAS